MSPLDGEEKVRTILENIQDSYFEVDLAGHFTFFNDALCRLTGFTREELTGEHYTRFSDKDNSRKVFKTFNAVFRTGEPAEGFDWMITTKDGARRYIEASVSLRKDSFDEPVGFRGIIRDITERKRVAEAMEKSEKKFESLFHLNPDPIAISDVETGRFIDVNQSFLEFSGYSRDEVLGFTSMDINLWVHPEDRRKIIGHLNDSSEVQGVEAMMRVKDGRIRHVLFSARFIEIEQKRYLLTLAHDITKRKQVEERYRNIFENAQEGIYQSTPEGKFIIVNNSVARILGYDSPEDVIAGMTDISRQLYVDPEERAKFTGKIEADGFVRDYEVRFYRKDGRIIWVSLTALGVRDEKGRIAYYEGIIEDITGRKESVERLRKALAGTVRAIASMVETRDPYTAGHQRSVGDLARAIATEMGLPSDRIEGLRVAGIIHDIGKISVPGEILSKPSKLTDIEFSIIKTHSRAGYEILKDIDFPWPVARMVVEHHERMDGSGYPQNLSGEDILPESRILAVADVVEAISAHRPYRPSLGLKFALDEISKNKGRLYDGDVVEACLKLFNEKGYTIKN